MTTDTKLLNEVLTIELVNNFKPFYWIKFIPNPYSGHDAEVYQGDKLEFYLETKVRLEYSTRYDSALIDESKGEYLKRLSNRARTFVAEFFLKDDITYLYKFAENGEINTSVIKEVKDCPISYLDNKGRKDKTVFLLPFESSKKIPGLYRGALNKLNV